MKNTFNDKVVIVTGASSGIGEAAARESAHNGSKVVLAARSEEKLMSPEYVAKWILSGIFFMFFVMFS